MDNIYQGKEWRKTLLGGWSGGWQDEFILDLLSLRSLSDIRQMTSSQLDLGKSWSLFNCHKD